MSRTSSNKLGGVLDQGLWVIVSLLFWCAVKFKTRRYERHRPVSKQNTHSHTDAFRNTSWNLRNQTLEYKDSLTLQRGWRIQKTPACYYGYGQHLFRVQGIPGSSTSSGRVLKEEETMCFWSLPGPQKFSVWTLVLCSGFVGSSYRLLLAFPGTDILSVLLCFDHFLF